MRRSFILHTAVILLTILMLPVTSVSADGPDLEDVTTHESILIYGDLELRTTAMIENWKGSGSHDDPFIISGYYMTTNDERTGLFLNGTSDHLILTDCIFDVEVELDTSFLAGMAAMVDCSNITIRNCSFISGGIPSISLYKCRNLSITGSDFYLGRSGYINIEWSEVISISDCNFTGKQAPVFLSSYSYDLNINGSSIDVDEHYSSFYFCDNLTISNNSIDGPADYGWHIYSSTSVMHGNTFTDGYGVNVLLNEVVTGSVVNNTLSGGEIGFYTYESSGIEFIGNNIDTNYISFAMSYTQNVRLSDNQMLSGGIYLFGSEENFWGYRITSDNMIAGRMVLFLNDTDLGSEMINQDDIGQIILVNVSNATIFNLDLYDTFVPITLAGCEDISVASCNMTDNSGAMYIEGCRRVHALQNTIGGGENGFFVVSSENSVFRENEIWVSSVPFQTEDTRGCVFEENTLYSWDEGFFMDVSVDDLVINNHLHSGKGIRILYSKGTRIEDNILESGDFRFPEFFIYDGDFPEPKGNIVRGREAIYLFNRVDEFHELDGIDIHNLLVFNCTDLKVSGASLRGKGIAKVVYSSNTRFNDLSIEGQHGFEVDESTAIVIENSSFTNITAEYALWLRRSVDTEVRECRFENVVNGVLIDRSDKCKVELSELSSLRRTGIKLTNGSSKIDVFNNLIYRAGRYGIEIESSWSNLIFGNNITGSDDEAVKIDFRSEGNTIYFNRFNYNKGSFDQWNEFRIQVKDEGRDNNWFHSGPNGNVGNLWADLNGPDDNDDGVIDRPYIIDEKRRIEDSFPLLNDNIPEYKEEKEKVRDRRTDSWLMIILIICIIGVVGYLTIRVIMVRD